MKEASILHDYLPVIYAPAKRRVPRSIAALRRCAGHSRRPRTERQGLARRARDFEFNTLSHQTAR